MSAASAEECESAAERSTIVDRWAGRLTGPGQLGITAAPTPGHRAAATDGRRQPYPTWHVLDCDTYVTGLDWRGGVPPSSGRPMHGAPVNETRHHLTHSLSAAMRRVKQYSTLLSAQLHVPPTVASMRSHLVVSVDCCDFHKCDARPTTAACYWSRLRMVIIIHWYSEWNVRRM